MIVLSRTPAPTDSSAALEAGLLSALATCSGERVVIVPHLYYLTPDHPATHAVRAFSGKLVVCAWLYPRAIMCILRSLGISQDAPVKAFDCRDFTDVADGAEQVLSHLHQDASQAGTHTPTAAGEEFTTSVQERWYPVIDYERCVNCRQCHEFCLFGVYAIDEPGQVQVVQPDKCKPGCPACSRLCPQGAILFPHCLTDEGIAGKPGAVIESGDVSAARSFARKNILAHQQRNSPSPSPSPLPTDELDQLITDLENLDT